MSIKRTNPDIGYVEPEAFLAAGISQTVRVRDTVHYSGITAVRGQIEVVAPNDLAKQIVYILETLKKLLEAEGLTMSNVVSTTTFCTDMAALANNGHLFAEAFRDHPPTSTWIGVKALAMPELMIELQVIAADD